MKINRFVLRRGISEAVGITIAFSIISITVLYIILNFLSLVTTSQQINITADDHVNEKLVLYGVAGSVRVKNVGSTTSYISYIVAVNANRNKIMLNTRYGDKCRITPSISIPPGATANITCTDPNIYAVTAVVTKNGKIFVLDPRLYALTIEETIGVPIQTVYGGIMITSTSGLVKLLEDRRIIAAEAVNTSVSLSLGVNRSGSVNGVIDASIVIIGRNPVNNKLNILVIGYGTSGAYIETGGSRLSLSRLVRFRLKIENLTTTQINMGIGVHPCYINTGSLCRLTFSGNADRILLYNTSSIRSGAVGLDPYIFVGDIDGNGNVETIFITQDFSTGNMNSINDRITISSSTVNNIDYSLKPVRIIFREIPIDSSRYSSAVLTVRMFYWDNSEDDIRDNDNRIIVRVGLYSVDRKEFVYSVYLSYHELSRYRHVKPLTVSYITKDFTIYIPKTNERYYVAIEFLDPYHLDSRNRNDADLIIGLEYVGIALASR